MSIDGMLLLNRARIVRSSCHNVELVLISKEKEKKRGGEGEGDRERGARSCYL